MLGQRHVQEGSTIGERTVRFQGTISGTATIPPGMCIFVPDHDALWITEAGLYVFSKSGVNGDTISMDSKVADDNDSLTAWTGPSGDDLWGFDVGDGPGTDVAIVDRNIRQRLVVPQIVLTDTPTPPFGFVHRFPPEWRIRPVASAISLKRGRRFRLRFVQGAGTTTFGVLAWVNYRIFRN